MSTEIKIARKKKNVSDADNSTQITDGGDHRKRRRNRTTQSCLNCHTSKRMCDRKRPCGRCTQLGLTGLCVYEVDDPSQRIDAQDESSRLRKRVAELEGVIRELKNKPHPRWVQSGSSPSEEFEKWHARSQSRPASDIPHDEDQELGSPPSLSQPTEQSCGIPQSKPPSIVHPSAEERSCILPPIYASSVYSQSSNASMQSRLSPYPSFLGVSSPISSPSPAVMTPAEDYRRPSVTIAGEHSSSNELDFSSFFMSYPGLMDSEDACALTNDGVKDNINGSTYLMAQTDYRVTESHCGCLDEAMSYNVVLELSLRLRKAADILSRSVNHRMGSACLLNQTIGELDALATTTLGSISIPPCDFMQFSPQCQSPVDASASEPMLVTTAYHSAPPHFGGLSNTTVPHPVQGAPSWETMSSLQESNPMCNDSFMSWEPLRRV